eukprot:m.234249 g.234249  ORF g.234249 m.234249 type:complete len:263 (-) comp19516_c0_seq1:23-811(-)
MAGVFALEPPTWDDKPVVEGYLRKIRGFAQNRTRFFRLTEKYFAFYARDRGELISYVHRSEIQSITDKDARRFEVKTSAVFGASGATSMVLEAPDEKVKFRWVSALRGAAASEEAKELIIEGYLTKVQSLTSGFSRRRWFTLTSHMLTYYECEGGEAMASVAVCDIDKVMEQGDDEFLVQAKHPFSKSGSSVLTLEAENQLVRDKWLSAFRRLRTFNTSGYTPLPQTTRPVSDHYGVVGKVGSQEEIDEPSEGNRFIRNRDL